MKIRSVILLNLALITTSIFSNHIRVSVISFLDEYSSIEATFNQLFNQTCSKTIEIIFVDTGDIDSSSMLSVARTFPVRLVNTAPLKNKSEILNAIIESCQGEFIMILNSGDTLNPSIIEEYIHTFDSDPAVDALYSDIIVRYEPYTPFENAGNWYLIHKPPFSPELLYYPILGPQCMWRKSMHQHYGLFDTSYSFFYILEFWNRAYTHGAKYQKIDATSGICFVPYGSGKKLFNDREQNNKGYQEIKAIHQKYAEVWHNNKKNCPIEKPFVIITASYKNGEWYKRNLDSLFNQNYSNYRIIYVDDCSPDNTAQLVEEYTKECKQEHKMTLIKNSQRLGAVANIYNAAHMCKSDEIIVIVDGDDWLAHPDVLTKLNEIYQDPHVWATYGQFLWFPFSIEGFAHTTNPETIAANNFRGSAWNITHLRTYYAALYQKIKKEDLLFEDGNFYPMTGDLAVMYPIMEMAGSHSAFVPDVIYIYNAENSINDNKVNIDLQGKCGYHILCRQPYKPLQMLC